MADPATNTSYPASLEVLPEIGANTKENDPGQEHDVMHDKAHATLNALQAYVGTSSDTAVDPTLTGRVMALESAGSAGAAAVNVLSGTAYDMGDLTAGAWHVFTSSSAVTITVEDDATEPVTANAEYGLEARGSGGVTLVEDNLATIIPPKGGTLELEESDFAVLKRTAEDYYKLVGSTVAA